MSARATSLRRKRLERSSTRALLRLPREAEQLRSARSARDAQLPPRAAALRVELHLLDRRLDTREIPGQHRALVPAQRNLNLAADVQHLRGVLGVARVV